jgi:hypothetical protein
MKNKLVTWNELKKELLKDSETYKEYKNLEPEYEIINEIIKARINQNISQKELYKK